MSDNRKNVTATGAGSLLTDKGCKADAIYTELACIAQRVDHMIIGVGKMGQNLTGLLAGLEAEVGQLADRVPAPGGGRRYRSFGEGYAFLDPKTLACR